MTKTAVRKGIIERMKKQIELTALFNLYKQHIVWILIASIVTGICGYVYARAFITPMYTSTSKMYINAQYDEEGRTSASILTSSRRLLDTYSAILLESNDFLNELGSQLPVKMSPAQLRSCIKLSSVSDTEIMKISVTTSDKNLSYEICKRFSDAAPGILYDIAKAGQVQVFSEPTKPISKSYPNNTEFAFKGIVAGFLVYCAALFVFHIFDNSIKSADDLKVRVGMPVLGEVPSFEKRPNKTKKNTEESTDGDDAK